MNNSLFLNVINTKKNIWTPAIIPNLALWWNPTENKYTDVEGTTPALDSDAVIANWTDKKSGLATIQASGTKQPLYFSPNKLIEFNAANLLRFAGANAGTTATSGTIFVTAVWDSPTGATNTILSSCDEATTSYYFAVRFISGKFCVTQRNNDTASDIRTTTSLIQGKLYVLTLRSNGSEYSFRINGVADSPVVSAGSNDGDWFGDTQNRDNFVLGSFRTTSEAALLDGKLGDVLVYNDYLSDSDCKLVEDYLTVKSFYNAELVGFGDSITAGLGASAVSKRWLSLVGTNKGWDAVNAGISSTVLQNTTPVLTNNGRDTYQSRVLSFYPTRVIILYGLNDLRYSGASFSDTLFGNDLGEIIDGLTSNGVLASNILVGSPPYIPEASYAIGSPYNAGTREKHAAYASACATVSSAKGVKYADVYQYMTDNGGDTLISVDGIHPNDAGHQAIADCMLAVL